MPKALLLFILFLAPQVWGQIACRQMLAARETAVPEGMIGITGYASVFNIKDAHGDIFLPGSFRIPEDGVILHLDHRTRTEVGEWTLVRQDAYGLYVEGYIDPRWPQAKKFLKRLDRTHGAQALSITHFAEKSAWDENLKAEVISESHLFAISLVEQGSNPLAYYQFQGRPNIHPPLDASYLPPVKKTLWQNVMNALGINKPE